MKLHAVDSSGLVAASKETISTNAIDRIQPLRRHGAALVRSYLSPPALQSFSFVAADANDGIRFQ